MVPRKYMSPLCLGHLDLHLCNLPWYLCHAFFTKTDEIWWECTTQYSSPSGIQAFWPITCFRLLIRSNAFVKAYVFYVTVVVINPLPPADVFWSNTSRRILKTLWPKVKLLMMRISPWPQCFQLYLTKKLYFMEIFQVFINMFSESSASELLYVGKG